MNFRTIIGIFLAALVTFTYAIYSPALAYQPSQTQTYEAKDGPPSRRGGHNRDQDQDKDKDNKKKDQQNQEDKNKKNKNDQNDKDHKNNDQNNDENKKHHQNNNDQNQNQHDDQHNDHHDQDNNQQNDQQNDQHHDQHNEDNQHDQNNQHHQDQNEHHNQNDHHQDQNHHDSHHDDDDKVGQLVVIFGTILFNEIQERNEARHVLERTATVLQRAQAIGLENYERNEVDHYSGLGRAISFQLRAKELYQDGRYKDSTFFSLRARHIALDYIHRVESYEDDWDDDDDYADGDYDRDPDEYDDVEMQYWEHCPAESEMSIGLEKWFISDHDALRIRIELKF